jgi:hypothetical protein
MLKKCRASVDFSEGRENPYLFSVETGRPSAAFR